jgi:integrase/recombinase XerD
MFASKINHKNEDRILLQFPFDSLKTEIVKSIANAKWSRTHKGWHIPYKKEAFKQLKQKFPDLKYEIKKPENTIEPAVAIISTIDNITYSQATIGVFPKQIFVNCTKNEADILFIKAIKYSRWDKIESHWIVPNYGANLENLKDYFEGRLHLNILDKNEPIVVPKISGGFVADINRPALNKFIETIQLKGYSERTLITYRNEFTQLLFVLKNKNIADLEPDRLRDYFLYCTNTLKLSENTIHSRMNAAKFYFEQVLGRNKMFFEIPRPKRPLLLPNVLAISEVEKLFSKFENLKHKTMLYLAYSAGMRVGEVVNLKLKDIHSARMVINIRGAKGKKDRTVALSEGILLLLRKYHESYKPSNWLFEGQDKTKPYTSRSLQEVFNKAKKATKIIQSITFHSLRHSYATHLHEAGTDIKLIQELLGHNDIKTTLRYTHVSKRTIENIKSPFDNLNLKID